MDDIDRAQDYQAALNEDAIGHILRMQGICRSAHFCVDCDERIPESRRAAVAGCMRCVECQRRIESTGAA